MNLKFLLRPKWIAGHIIVIVMVSIMIWASNWQWTSLQEQKADNIATAAALAAPPQQVTTASQLDAIKDYTPVELVGTWYPSRSVYLRYPIFNSFQGYYVMVPLQLADGTTALVNRGWISQEAGLDNSQSTDAPVPLTVDGVVRRNDRPEGPTSATKGSPAIPTVTSFDDAALPGYFQVDSLPKAYVELRSPATDTDPAVLPNPEISEGSHWSYTLQWAAFAILTVIGYGILLRRARQDTIDDAQPS